MDQRRKIESESEARRCLSAVERSGLSIKEWARARGIDGRSLHAWKMNLDRPTAPARRGRHPRSVARSAPSAMQLVELVPATNAAGSRYVLRVGSASVEFGDNFDDATLRRVIAVLGSC